MYVYQYRHRVRYRECDPMGVVYHAHYVDYFEYTRTEALRELGLPYKALEDAGIIMPVVDMGLRYRKPAKYDDLLEISASISEMPGIRLRIDYQVRRAEDQSLLTDGHVTLCFVDRGRNRPIPAPAEVKEVFGPYFDRIAP
jgi:acyl-CoA thioester hydrolase